MADADKSLPPCGIYRTKVEVAGVPAGRLVYFHNHGEPGPGLYLPAAWTKNRANFQTQGFTLPTPAAAKDLEALPSEGMYRVKNAFFCCRNMCKQFQADQMLQLGYNGLGEPIVFEPAWENGQFVLPEKGTRIDMASFAAMSALKIPEIRTEGSAQNAFHDHSDGN